MSLKQEKKLVFKQLFTFFKAHCSIAFHVAYEHFAMHILLNMFHINQKWLCGTNKSMTIASDIVVTKFM